MRTPLAVAISLAIALALFVSSCATINPVADQPAAPAPTSLRLPLLFSDHCVLQQGIDLPVWGWDIPGQAVAVRFREETKRTVADGACRWRVVLPPQGPAVDGTQLRVEGSSPIVVNDVLVGDVWVCSGQSNMEFQLIKSEGGPEAVAGANDPDLRLFLTHRRGQPEPATDVAGTTWTLTTPETVVNFSAVAYYFARELRRQRPNLPIGLIEANWSGTRAEAWTPPAALKRIPRYATELAEYRAGLTLPPETPEEFATRFNKWIADSFPPTPAGRGLKGGWEKPGFDDSHWKEMSLPGFWEREGLYADGRVWFRRSVDIPSDWEGRQLTIGLGAVDDLEEVWINGHFVGSREVDGPLWWAGVHEYPVPPDDFHAGRNEIAVRILDISGGGGISGYPSSLNIRPSDAAATSAIGLAGMWKYAEEATIPHASTKPPRGRLEAASNYAPGNLYNGMIAPLTPYGIAGTIWYQGESNENVANEYADLLELLIRGWRKAWRQGEFPFLIVQIAPFESYLGSFEASSAAVREAQAETILRVPRTALVVTTDCGDQSDIHPKDKLTVGERLARAARSLAWGEKITPMSPIFRRARRSGGAMEVRFDYAPGGVELRSEDFSDFWVAGGDRVFHPALARVEDGRLFVESPEVPRPAAVRFGWSSVPGAPLFSTEGLPVSPFRSDRWSDRSVTWAHDGGTK